MKRKNDKKKDNEEVMVFRQDFECPPPHPGEIRLPSDDESRQIDREFAEYFRKKMKERIERMTLKCTKSKSTLFTAGRAYKVLAATYDEDTDERLYLLETDRGSTCYTGLKGCQGEFRAEERDNDV